MDYDQRLKHLKLTTLEARWHRGELIQMYKSITAKDKSRCQQFFQRDPNIHGLMRTQPEVVHSRSQDDTVKQILQSPCTAGLE